jgi:hypothetical protein
VTDERKRRMQRKRAVEKARRNRDEARAKLLAQHRNLARSRAENRRRMADAGKETGDSGPHSTVPSTDTEDEAATGPRYATVPRRVRGSDDNPPMRLYGLRLRDAASEARDGDDTDGTGAAER